MMVHVLAAALVMCAPPPAEPVAVKPMTATDGARGMVERTVADFSRIASEGWDDWRLCELHSKGDDKRAFLNRSFGKTFVPPGAAVQWKEIQASEEAADTGLHLGVVVVTYPDAGAASAALAQLSGIAHPYLKNTKILTEFRAASSGAHLVVAYSETGNHPKLQRFFGSFAPAR